MKGVLTSILHTVDCADLSHWLTFYSLLAICQRNKGKLALLLTTVEPVSLSLAFTNYNRFHLSYVFGTNMIAFVQR